METSHHHRPQTHSRSQQRSTEVSPRLKARRFSPYSPAHPLPSPLSTVSPSPHIDSVPRTTAPPKEPYQMSGYLPTPSPGEEIAYAWSAASSTSPSLSLNGSSFDVIANYEPSIGMMHAGEHLPYLQAGDLIPADTLFDSANLSKINVNPSGNPTNELSFGLVPSESVRAHPEPLDTTTQSNVLSITCANISHAIEDTNDVSHHFSRTLSGIEPPITVVAGQEPVPPIPSSEDEVAVLSISTAFHPGSHPLLPRPDVIIVSADETLFYVHSATLKAAAPHVFRDVLDESKAGLFSTPPQQAQDYGISPAAVREASRWLVQPYPHAGPSTSQVWLKMDLFTADELNIMLHAFYDTSCAAHQPSIQTLESAIDKMADPLGIVNNLLITPSSSLFAHLVNWTPLHPLRIYGIAARHSIHELAIKASSHLLSFSFSSLTDEEAVKIGPVYLKKLVLLHLQRSERLRDLLLKPPHPHAPTKSCGFREQKVLESMWAAVVVNIAWDVRPDMSTASLQRALSPIANRLECDLCRGTLEARIGDVLKTWASVEHSIV